MILPLAFLLSGVAALTFEVVWFHLCGLAFGNTVWSATIVLSSFMAGLGLGSALAGAFGHRLRKPVATYAVAELAVALSGVGLTYGLPLLAAPLAQLAGSAEHSIVGPDLVRFAAAFLLMVVPTTAMGATLPLLIGALSASAEPFGTVTGRLYGWNTAGAVLGAVGAEFLLVGQFGITGSAWTAALLNVAAAALAWTVRPSPSPSVRVAAASAVVPAATATVVRLLLCAFIAGASLMALEVLWFRLLSLFVVNSTAAFAIMLAAVLASIAFGSLLASRWIAGHVVNSGAIPLLALGAGLTTIGFYAFMPYVLTNSWTAEPLDIARLAVTLTMAPSAASGALFACLGHRLEREMGRPMRAAGALTVANTTGALFGSGVSGLVLLPAIGMEAGLTLVALAYALLAVLAMDTGAESVARRRRGLSLAAVAVAASVLLRFPVGLMTSTYLPMAAQKYASDGSTIVAAREGPAETILLMQQTWLQQPVYHRLVANGVSMTGTHATGARYMRAFAYLPGLIGTAPEKVLVICYGLGVTVAATEDLPSPRSIDVVEISPDILAMSEYVYTADRHPLKDPRVRLFVEDGRQFLLAGSERYDLITGEPPPPLSPGAGNLFSRDYFQLVRERLTDRGLVSYWLPLARDGEYDIGPIIRAFCDVFADCTLWNGSPFDWVLVGSRATAAAGTAVTYERFVGAWQSPTLGPRLRGIGLESPAQLGAMFLADAVYLRQLTRDVLPLTDDFPRRLLQPTPVRDALVDLLDARAARRRFESSLQMRSLLPEPLLSATASEFEHQALINRVMTDGANPLRDIDELHRLLTTTNLRRLPLWLLGSHDRLQQIAESGSDGGGLVEYELGLRALAIRNYRGAINNFIAAERKGLSMPWLIPLRAYALVMAGSRDDAGRVAVSQRPDTDVERRYWEWLRRTFPMPQL